MQKLEDVAQIVPIPIVHVIAVCTGFALLLSRISTPSVLVTAAQGLEAICL